MENEPEQEWQKLCKLIEHETDSKKLSQYVNELIEALDARKKTLGSSSNGYASAPKPIEGK
jgi:hypothetical protein